MSIPTGTTNVGIGTTAPISKLQVTGATTSSGILISNSTSSLNIGTIANHATWQGSGSSDDFVVSGYGARNLIIGTNGAERMRITSAGNVGIGTASPTALLHVSGQVTATGFTGTLDGILGSGTPAAATVTQLTSGGVIVSDTDSTDDLGTTGVRWANLFVDAITATDQITATGFTGTLDGILGSGAAAAATTTTLDTSGVVNLNLITDSTSSTSGALIIDGGVGVAKKLFVGTDFDVSGNSVIDGTALVTGVATFGDDVVSDTDSTDDLGTTGVRWANLFVDGITATDQITATGFTGTLDGILGSGAAAAATVTTLTTSGIVSVDDTTTSTSGTTGSIHTDGGLGVAGTAFVAGAATVGGASQFNSTVTVGVDDTGYDVKFFGATASRYMLWDESADSLRLTDNTALTFGDSGSDLTINHDGSNSFITDGGMEHFIFKALVEYLFVLVMAVKILLDSQMMVRPHFITIILPGSQQRQLALLVQGITSLSMTRVLMPPLDHISILVETLPLPLTVMEWELFVSLGITMLGKPLITHQCTLLI